MGFPWWIIGKEFMGNAGDMGQESLDQKDPLEKEVKQPTAIFLPGKSQLILEEINWIFIGRTDVEAPMFWPPDVKNWLIGKDPVAGKDWGQEEKGVTEDEIVR